MGMAAEAQYHVLAVDDSLLDRKLIERLLKTSSYHGNFIFFLVLENQVSVLNYGCDTKSKLGF